MKPMRQGVFYSFSIRRRRMVHRRAFVARIVCEVSQIMQDETGWYIRLVSFWPHRIIVTDPTPVGEGWGRNFWLQAARLKDRLPSRSGRRARE